jgi:hypothetical protein
MRGQDDLARAAFGRSTVAAKANTPTPRLSAFRQFALNEFHLDQGWTKVVRTWTEKVLEVAQRQTRRTGVRAQALVDISRARLSLMDAADATDEASRQRHLGESQRYIEGCVIGLRGNNQLDELPRALVVRAAFGRMAELYGDAAKDLAEALEIARQFGMPLLFVDASLEAARLALVSQLLIDNRDVAGHLHEAERLVNELGYERRRKDLDDLRQAAPAP